MRRGGGRDGPHRRPDDTTALAVAVPGTRIVTRNPTAPLRELWRVSGLARDRYVVIVSADPINAGQQYPNVQGVPVVDEIAAPANLLIASVTAPVEGKALVPDVGPTPKARLAERLGTVPDAELDEICRGLAALIDL